MPIDATLQALQDDPDLRGNFVHWQVEPALPPRYGDWPSGLDARLLAALEQRGIAQPYTHQAAAIAGALAGRDQVVVTPTASGKSLGYIVPVLEAILREPASRALLLFPTKALAQDQLHEIHGLISDAAIDVKAFTYDGDTSPTARLSLIHI